MGIRYYGWAVSRDEVIEATDDPWPVIRRADQRHDLAGWTNTSLDKAWWRMQALFSAERTRVRRPGYDLVAGAVTYPEEAALGYLPHIGVIDRDHVREIALDLASVKDVDVRQHSAELRYSDESRRESDREYLTHYLGVARSFTEDAAAQGHGIVYSIG
ncbi:MAG TPA: DUF1877 family protein [Microlunatus sp.]